MIPDSSKITTNFEMSADMQPVNQPRRSFLGGLVAGLGGLIAMTRLNSAPAASVPQPEQQQENAGYKGYHESAHVRSYYDKARF